MEKNKNVILVTGGHGMVGKHLKVLMPDAFYASREDADLTDFSQTRELIGDIQPNIIVHLAAKVGGILDNITNPAEYFDKNCLINMNVLRTAKEFNCKRFIGILSTCVYPAEAKKYPLTENMLHDGVPEITNLSYAIAKRALATQIEAYNKQYGFRYNYLIPCNLYGNGDFSESKGHFVNALIAKIHKAKQNCHNSIRLFGNGNPLRQFMHAQDLAKVINYCIIHDIYENMNVATDENKSIKEIAEIALDACEAKDIKIAWDVTKPNGQARKDADHSKLMTLFPQFKPLSLYDGIKTTYQAYKQADTAC